MTHRSLASQHWHPNSRTVARRVALSPTTAGHTARNSFNRSMRSQQIACRNSWSVGDNQAISWRATLTSSRICANRASLVRRSRSMGAPRFLLQYQAISSPPWAAEIYEIEQTFAGNRTDRYGPHRKDRARRSVWFDVRPRPESTEHHRRAGTVRALTQERQPAADRLGACAGDAAVEPDGEELRTGWD